ncbi:SGNH/GDSL hydrolase family protein [Glaciibacter superstes]|uniref:SGNH/GDSL hydrolase family protein n=1 Tax=Glaciibacter superstes TaxID=501023 RepID=UPI0003B6394A|nr:SGNH/GDSL hydrolase family protein [Glaciibacter superstes]
MSEPRTPGTEEYAAPRLKPKSRNRKSTVLWGGITVLGMFLSAGTASAAADVITPVTPADAHLAGLEYVALGDSYSAGFGLTPYSDVPAAGCFQADANYPHLVAAELGLALTDATCSGAVTANIIDLPQNTGLGVAPIQSEALSASTDIVTVTIGGNDLGFAAVAQSCAALSATGPTLTGLDSCKAFYNPAPGVDILLNRLADPVTAAIGAAYADIHAKAPNAKIFVIGYPAVAPNEANIPEGGCFTSAIGTGQPPFPENAYPFTDIDVPYLHSIESALDKVIGDQAAIVGATYLPTIAQTVDHTPCAGDADPFINGVTIEEFIPADPISTSQISLKLGALHPNEAGVAFLEGQVTAAVRAAFPATVPDVVPADTVVPAKPTLAATGTEATGWLAMGGILLLGGGLLFATRRRPAASASR